MKGKSICISLFLIAAAISTAGAASLADSICPIYFTGETGVRFGSGVIVGDGSFVVTTADLAQEQVGPETSLTIKFSIVLIPSTGEAYRAETVLVDSKGNVAVLKLPAAGLTAVPMADNSQLKSAPSITLGQMLTEDAPGRPWAAEILAYSRNKTSGKMELTTWQTKNAFSTEAKGCTWLFLSEVDRADPVPAGAVVTRPDSGVAALYVSKFTIEGGTKPVQLHMASPAQTLTTVLQKAGASITSLKTPPAHTYKSDGKEAEAFQITSRALVAVLSGSWEKAVTEAKALAVLRPENTNAQMLYGVALAGGGKTEEAIKALDKALEIDPKLAGAHLSRGAAYAASKKVKEAEADYRKAMELSPRDTRPMIWLAELLSLDEKRLDESVQLAQRAVNLEPNSPTVHMSLARILGIKGEHEKAIAELNEALRISPSLGAARAALGAAYAAAGRIAEAEKEFRKLAEDEPKNPNALFELAAFLKSQGKDEEAKKAADKVLELGPSSELKAAVEDLLKKKTDEKHREGR